MAENSENSAAEGKQSTRRTAKLTVEQALEIVQAALGEYQKAGGRVEIVPEMYHAGERMVAVILPGTQFTNNQLVPLMAQPEK